MPQDEPHPCFPYGGPPARNADDMGLPSPLPAPPAPTVPQDEPSAEMVEAVARKICDVVEAEGPFFNTLTAARAAILAMQARQSAPAMEGREICRCSQLARNNRVAARMGAEFVPSAPTMPQDEVEAMVERSTAHARQLRDFWAQDGGTSIHLVAADNLDEQSALLTRLSAQLKDAREALDYAAGELEDVGHEEAAKISRAALKGSAQEEQGRG